MKLTPSYRAELTIMKLAEADEKNEYHLVKFSFIVRLNSKNIWILSFDLLNE